MATRSNAPARQEPGNGNTSIQPANSDAGGVSLGVMERVLLNDLAALTSSQRVEYYLARCKAAGLDPRTKPFDYITFQGKLTLYPNVTATQQIADKRNICIEIRSREQIGELLVITARGTNPNGRSEERIGALCIAGLKGQDLANAMMKVESKAVRRVVVALTGLAADVEGDQNGGGDRDAARYVNVNTETGEILQAPALPDPRQRLSEATRRMLDAWGTRYGPLDGSPESKTALATYVSGVLGRVPASASEPAARAADYEVVASDLEDQPLALTAATAAYKATGADPHEGEGETMRREITRITRFACVSRSTTPAAVLRLFADACKSQEAGAVGLADPLDDTDDSAGDDGVLQGTLIDSDPLQGQTGG